MHRHCGKCCWIVTRERCRRQTVSRPYYPGTVPFALICMRHSLPVEYRRTICRPCSFASEFDVNQHVSTVYRIAPELADRIAQRDRLCTITTASFPQGSPHRVHGTNSAVGVTRLVVWVGAHFAVHLAFILGRVILCPRPNDILKGHHMCLQKSERNLPKLTPLADVRDTMANLGIVSQE